MPKHRLVVLGDSLSQGVQSGAVFTPELSYPAQVAAALGMTPEDFRFPGYTYLGGFPVNIEYLLRRLESSYGDSLNALNVFGAAFSLRSWMDDIEDYWERGRGRDPRHPAGPYHNLACWGMTADDVLNLNAGFCMARCSRPVTDDWVNQVPEAAFYRNALTVLNPTHDPAGMHRTAILAARDLASGDGIENLIVWLGANNALATMTTLAIRETDDAVLSGIPDEANEVREDYNLWRPEHFEAIYGRVAAGVESLQADRVFWGTVPHVTIAPIARGVRQNDDPRADRLDADPRYFRYYTHFWIGDDVFDPARHPHLTGEQAKYIDGVIDGYNAVIRRAVEGGRSRGRSWFIVDLAAVLERVAYRRYREVGLAPPGGSYQFPPGWSQALDHAGVPELTTHYLSAEGGKLTRGGLFSLDGIHPTTMGYGLVAHEVVAVMRQAGVEFRNPLTGAAVADPPGIDFAALLGRDTLVRHPPGLLADAIGILNWLDGWIGLEGILQTINGASG
jgi:hypothetical protein